MEKLVGRDNEAANDKSFPMILTTVKQKEDQSNKTLFRNNSESSSDDNQQPYYSIKSKNEFNIPQIDQIKRFIKRADVLNTNNYKKLKQDKQIQIITKNDRSVASFYKNSRHIEYENDDFGQKEKQIKKIYMSKNVKQKKKYEYNKRNYIVKVAKEVQTQAQKQPLFNESQKSFLQDVKPIRHLRYHSINTIHDSVIEQQSLKKEKEKGRTPLVKIQEDLEEDSQLPQREKKINPNRNKVFSMTSGNLKSGISTKAGSYLETISKNSYDFQVGITRLPQNRHKEYKDQKTIFSKTIDVKPLIFKNETYQNVFLNENEESTNFSKVLFSSMAKAERENNQKSDKNNINNININNNQVIKENAISKKSSMSVIAEKTQNNTIINSLASHDIKFGKTYKSRLTSSKISEEKQSKSRSRHSQNSPKQLKKKSSYLVQVPSFHEIKIDDISNMNQNIKHHPIKNNFGDKEADWIVNSYQPKNQLFNNIDPQSFQIKKYKNGVYFGQLSEEGKKHGKGIIFYFNGRIYEGQFEQDIKNGKGHELYPDGSLYRGDFQSGMKEGKGIFQWSNGEIYDGQWKAGKKCGSGIWKSANGQSYIGEWKNGKVDGFGVYLMNNGCRYEGEFKNSLKHGLGTERYSNGQTYVGSYEKNRPNGEGEYFWANGDYYKGQFSNGFRHGAGFFKQHKNNTQFRGNYRNDKKCGYGQLKYGNGDIYIGNFQNSLRHGFGQFFQKEKLIYKGYWMNDNMVQSEQSKIKAKMGSIIQSELERQQSLPVAIKINTINMNNKQNDSPSVSKNKGSKSPIGSKSIENIREDANENVKRPCGCHRKH